MNTIKKTAGIFNMLILAAAVLLFSPVFAHSVTLTSVTLDAENAEGLTFNAPGGIFSTSLGDTHPQIGVMADGIFLNTPSGNIELGEVSIELNPGINTFEMFASTAYSNRGLIPYYGLVLFFDRVRQFPQIVVYNSNGGTGDFLVQPEGTIIVGCANGGPFFDEASGTSIYDAPDGSRVELIKFNVDHQVSISRDEVSWGTSDPDGFLDIVAQVTLNYIPAPVMELPSDAQACINSQDAVISVPLTLNNADSVPVESLDVKVKFDSTVLASAGATLTGGVLADRNYEIVSQVNDAGEISATIFAGGDLFNGSGVIAYLSFYVTGELGDITPLTFAKAKLNEVSVETGSGSVEITECRYDISGNIGYYSNGVPVSGVLLELEGDEYRSAATDEAGNYLLSDIPEGGYTLAPYKNDHFGGISGLDASRIAKYAAGFPDVEFTHYERRAADVDLDGQITGLDASRVARYAAGKISYLNDEDIHWVFALPPSIVSGDEEFFRTYSPLNEDKEHQDFVAVRLGDVTGNWSDEPVREKRHSRSVCQVAADQGALLTVPAVLNQETAVEGADISISFDADVLDFTGATLAGGILENSGYALIAGGTEGEAKLVISASADAATGTGETVFLSFDIVGEPGDAAVISLTDFQVNETEVSGGFRINGETCREIRLSVETGEPDTAAAK